MASDELELLESAPEVLRRLLHDPEAYYGFAIGSCSVLLVVCVLCATGQVRCMPCRMRRPWCLRPGRALYTDGDDTFYECLEEDEGFLGGSIDLLRQAAYTTYERPSELCLYGGGGSNPSARSSQSKRSNVVLRELRGRSLKMLAPEEREPAELRPGEFHEHSWSPADASKLRVRVGPNYLRHGRKEPSGPALYDCLGMDLFEAGCRVDKVVPVGLCPLPTGGEGWQRKCRIPRVLVINGLLPFEVGPRLFGKHPIDDHGVSVVGQFVASRALIQASLELAEMEEAATAPDASASSSSSHAVPAANALWPAVRLLRDFMQRGKLFIPNATSRTSCVLKVIGWVEDIEKVSIPRILAPTVHKYNGKPVLITYQGELYVDTVGGEWMEIDFDVRRFGLPCRSFLHGLRDRFKLVSTQLAFVLQGTADEELPEVVLGTVRLHALDLHAGCWLVDPRASKPIDADADPDV